VTIDEGEIFKRLVRLWHVLEDLPEPDRVDILRIAWLTTTQDARQSRLPIPNGFVRERDRQLAMLTDMRRHAEEAEPDLFEEYAFGLKDPEATAEALLKHYRELRAQLADGGDKQPTDDDGGDEE